MALKETIQRMKTQISSIMHDLDKAETGNKAAAQRARTASIKFSKTAKVFRKESVAAVKSAQKKAARAEKARKTAPRKTSAKKKAPARKKKR